MSYVLLGGAAHRMSSSKSVLSVFYLETSFTELFHFLKTEEIRTLVWSFCIWRAAEVMLYKHLVELKNTSPDTKY